MPAASNRRVAILGGGIAGLTAAWALSEPDVRSDIEVCVFESEPYLGGKGASTRGMHGRIEEHGLHVWLGYYHNAFRLMSEVYGELDRPTTDPGCPLATWKDAFTPSDLVGVEDHRDEVWSHWVASFSRNHEEPGVWREQARAFAPLTFVRRGLALLTDFSRSVGRPPATSAAHGIVLSGSPRPPRSDAARLAEFAELLRQAEIAAVVGAIESLRLLQASIPSSGSLATLVLGHLEEMRVELLQRVDRGSDLRRTAELADMVISAVIGLIREGLLLDAAGFSRIDHLDFRDWLSRHGARPHTLQSALIRGMYDLVFAYEDGDVSRPRFPAGLGLSLAGKLFFEYHGAIFWRMQAGMGDVVFAPLYQALCARGVRFRTSHHVERLRLGATRSAIQAIEIACDCAPHAHAPSLSRVKELPCFQSPSRAYRVGRLNRRMVLQAGVDFDDVILATSLGPVRSLATELLEDSPAWRTMCGALATVPTQSLQLWLREDERQLGWPYPGATVSGYVTPFDTYASMSHLISREAWPPTDEPRSLAYFCSVLPRQDAGDPVRADNQVRRNADTFLRRDAGHLWPSAVAAEEGFRWDLLCGANGAIGRGRLDSQYWRANVDPAAQYVQALPGTDEFRLRADGSGYRNLFLAGDWIDCGLNAGCIEAAVMGGVQAANALLGLPRGRGILGSGTGRPS